MLKRLMIFSAILLIALSISSFAAIPRMINFQGKLTSLLGTPEANPQTLVFKIWDTDSGGTIPIWTSSDVDVTPDMAGQFSLILENGSPSLDTVNFNQALWLEIVHSGNPFAPRQRLTAVPYAFYAVTAESGGGGGGSGGWTEDVGGNKVYVTDVGRNVGIGTTEPAYLLHVASSEAAKTMYFDSVKGAFGAGGNISTGGNYSVAMGFNSSANNNYSTAIGNSAYASGDQSVSIGGNTYANAHYSTAIGYQTKTNSPYSMALGKWVESSGTNAIVLGSGAGNIYKIINDKADSLMVGFNSDIPTLFVGPSSGLGTFGNVGIGTTEPTSMLTVAGTIDAMDYYKNGVPFSSGGGGISTAEADTRYIMNTTEAQAGTLNITGEGIFGGSLKVVGNAEIGDTLCSATGPNSVAMGYRTTSDGNQSTAMGYRTSAGGAGKVASTAMGSWTTAGGNYSTAMGDHTTADGPGSTSMGYYTTANGFFSTAMGDHTSTGPAGYASTAMGSNTIAAGRYSTAMGNNTFATGEASTAIGSSISVQGEHSVGIGLTTEAYTITKPNTMAIMGGKVGIGTTEPASILTVAGTIETTLGGIKFPGGGIQTVAYTGGGGGISTAEADARYIMNTPEAQTANINILGKLKVLGSAEIGDASNSATGVNSIALGHGTSAIGDYSIAMGEDTNASGIRSIAMGDGANASNENCFALGHNAIASESHAIAMGKDAKAGGYAAAAIGQETSAGGNSVAMGYQTTANGGTSTAMGYGTKASGTSSTAMGEAITAQGAHTFGIGLTTEAFTITSPNTMAIMGGNVGIGTAEPGYKLEVNADIVAKGGTGTGAGLYIGLFKDTGSLPGYGGDSYPTLKTNANKIYFAAGGSYEAYLGGGTNSEFGLIGAGTSLVYLTTNGNSYFMGGNIGVGTPEPQYKLDVKGLTDGIINIDSGSSEYNSWTFHSINGVVKAAIGYRSAINGVSIFESNDNRLVVTNGKVGIGTTEPTATLEVAGQIKIKDGSQGAGKVLTSDGGGLASWQTAAAGGISTAEADTRYIMNTTEAKAGNINISGRLKVVGSAEIGGASCSATGDNSIAMVSGSSAEGSSSIAMGRNAIANRSDAVAIGLNSRAEGNSATAIGGGFSEGGNSIAIGGQAHAFGNYSTAMGQSTSARGNNSTAIGYQTTAYANNTTTLGTGITAQGDYSVGIGLATFEYTITSPNTMAIMGGNVGIGTTEPAATLDVNGTVKIAKVLTVAQDSGATLTTADFGKTITVNSGSDQTITLPDIGAGDIGGTFTIVKLGAGIVTIDAVGSDVIADSSAGGKIYDNVAGETYANITIQVAAADKWIIVGGHGTWTTQ